MAASSANTHRIPRIASHNTYYEINDTHAHHDNSDDEAHTWRTNTIESKSVHISIQNDQTNTRENVHETSAPEPTEKTAPSRHALREDELDEELNEAEKAGERK